MMDRLDKSRCPSLEEMGEYVGNPLFSQFCAEVKDRYQCAERIEFSACSMEKGWNVKFKKSGKALCTVYPRESYFTAMGVVGPAQLCRRAPGALRPYPGGERTEVAHDRPGGPGRSVP